MIRQARAAALQGAAALKLDEEPPPPAPAENPAALAAYIAEMAAELAALAGGAGLPMLAYFLNLARVEAQIYARELGDREPAHRGR